MNKKVKVLPPEIVNKIAAGEVVERPASVVKELLENSLDAGARSINITIKQAGRSLIKIADDGNGISKDDIETVFLRHATSKISSIDDLYSIHSFGFRGEALFSIAAISDIRLRSKTKEQETGWELHLRGGSVLSSKPVAMSGGTEIEIQELFYNTPARRKFMKRDATEMSHITNTVLSHALINNEVAFTLFSDHRSKMKTILELPPTQSRQDRVCMALNLNKANLIQEEIHLKEYDVLLSCMLGDSNIRRSNKDLQFVFVNKRPVYNRSLAYHINEAYHMIFPSGTNPFFVININIPSKNVDANVHPTKREVKIENEYKISQQIRYIIEDLLVARSAPRHVIEYEKSGNESHQEIFSKVIKTNKSNTKSFESNKYPTGYIREATKSLLEQPETVIQANDSHSLNQLLENAKYVGVFNNKYLFYEVANNILILDQHAAQERFVYEKLMKQLSNNSIEIQHLLTPFVLSCSASEIHAWEEKKDILSKFGFSTTLFDNQTIAVHSHPSLIKDVELAVRNIISEDKYETVDKETLARKACRNSVMSGDYVDSFTAEVLRQNLLECEDPFICPHGRPTVIELSESFLDKQFMRS